MSTRAFGGRWEQHAESYLRERGLTPLRRNFHCRMGEIDLIMNDQGVTVFVEVRYRGPGSLLSAAETVDRGKQLKLSRAAGIFLSRNPRLAAGPCRFDVICIDADRSGTRLGWVRNAFESTLN